MMTSTCVDQVVSTEFSVPFTHRLYTTNDLFGEDRDVLQSVFEATDGQTTRILCIVDGDVLDANPDLTERIEASFSGADAPGQLVTQVVRQLGGEDVKNSLGHLHSVLQQIHDGQLDRRSYVFVIGGGAVLDAVGFAAAIAHRGIRLVRVPTTTLGQADSGVGVKNSINWFRQKNWVGTFAVPWAVINDASMLKSLPDRDFRCGFSEAVKVALLKDADFFGFLCKHASQIAQRDENTSAEAIFASAKHHLRHITHGGDPFERLEARPLDFGHWSAHKLEVLSNFELRHGEAVGIGVAIDCIYSGMKLGMPSADVDRVLNCLKELQLPLYHPQLENVDALFAGLDEFRQHLGGRLTLTMLQDVGRPIDVHEIDDVAMREAIRQVTNLFK